MKKLIGIGAVFLLMVLMVGSMFAGGSFSTDYVYAGSIDSGNQIADQSVGYLYYATASTTITSPFGRRTDPVTGQLNSSHYGTDYRCKSGDPIYATAAGVVAVADQTDNSELGINITLEHSEMISSQYGHLSKILVSVGQTIRNHQIIGECGSTGKSTGSHLHLVLWKNGKREDIAPYLKRWEINSSD